MKIVSVECMVEDEETGLTGVQHVPLDLFMDAARDYLFGDASDVEAETESTVLAAVEGAEAVTRVIPRSAVEELVKAKTRGELYEKLAAMLAPYGITIAEA